MSGDLTGSVAVVDNLAPAAGRLASLTRPSETKVGGCSCGHVWHVSKVTRALSMRRSRKLKGFAASSELPPELRGARMLVLVDRESGARLMISVFATEEALRSGDAVMNAGNPQNAGKRTSVEFFELAGELAL